MFLLGVGVSRLGSPSGPGAPGSFFPLGHATGTLPSPFHLRAYKWLRSFLQVNSQIIGLKPL